jgi:tRNA C32,U32 (ribose-2'-O)-methylase TrmJ
MTQPPERVDQRIVYPPATVGAIDAFVVLLEHALREINFFKSPSAPSKMRSLRSMTHRAQPNAREIMLLTAIAHELISYVKKLRSKISN